MTRTADTVFAMDRGFGQVLIVGCGYTGRRLAAHFCNNGVETFGVSRSRSSFQHDKFSNVVTDLDKSVLEVPVRSDGMLIYYLVPPPNSGVEDLRLERFLKNAVFGTPRKFVLVSTTGVYGDCRGAWIDESTAANPRTDRARRRMDAERRCTDWCARRGVSLTVLRVAAIYGPDRVPVERIQQGIRVPTDEVCGYTNRIHVDDLVAVCVAVSSLSAGEIYNVSDGHPMRMTEYFRLVAELWGLTPPEVVEGPISQLGHGSVMQQYLTESRKIDNQAMLRDLGVSLAYQDVRKGLMHCFSKQC